MHRNGEKPVRQQPRLNTHKLRRPARTIGATSPQHQTTQKKEKTFNPEQRAQRKETSHPETTQESQLLCHYNTLVKIMLNLHRVEI